MKSKTRSRTSFDNTTASVKKIIGSQAIYIIFFMILDEFWTMDSEKKKIEAGGGLNKMSTLGILSKIWYFASPSPSFLKVTESAKKLYVCWKLEETNNLDIIQSTYEML